MITEPQVTDPPPGIGIVDVLQVLFKWKKFILSFAGIGLVVSIVVWFTQKPLFFSTASVLVLYVAQAKGAVPGVGEDEKILSPDRSGINILGTELGILTSLDLCEKVVELVGVEKIVGPKRAAEGNRAAALIVQRRLSADSPRKSNLINVSFTHEDPEVARITLQYVLEKYKEKHLEVHRNRGNADEFLRNQAGEWMTRLMQTEDQIRKLKESVGVISLEESKKSASAQINMLKQSIFSAEAELAELRGVLGITNASATPSAPLFTNSAPVEVLHEYEKLLTRQLALRDEQIELEGRFTGEHPRVINNSNLIGVTERLKKEIETKHPTIGAMLAAQRMAASNSAANPTQMAVSRGPALDDGRIAQLLARINILTNQEAKVRSEVYALESIESRLSMLQRRKDLEELTYRSFEQGKERAELDEKLGKDRGSNINVVQSPSTPVPDSRGKLKKAGIPFGIAAAFGLVVPLIIELLLKQCIYSARQIETGFNFPVLLTFPLIRSVVTGKKGGWLGRFLRRKTVQQNLVPCETAFWAEGHQLRQYFIALRDRTLMYFENNTAIPKLVAVTGIKPHSGVTSIAAGLAATLSETGEGKVLLVDLNNSKDGSIHPYLGGQPVNLADLIAGQGADSQVQANLFLACANDPSSKMESALPTNLRKLLPKLRASTFDFVIFDLPPISPTSITPRLASTMDLMMVVIESEQVPKNLLKTRLELIKGNEQKVVGVVNKATDYLPYWLAHH